MYKYLYLEHGFVIKVAFITSRDVWNIEHKVL